MVNNNNSNSNTNNNNKQCQTCLKRKKNSTARCFFSCKGKTCNKCINKVRKSGNPSCPTCRRNIRQPGNHRRARAPVNYTTAELYARVAQQQMRMLAARRVAAAARAALAAEQRPNFMEPSPLMNRMVARRGARTGSMSPPPRLQIPQSNSNSNNNNNMPSLHTGGLVRKTAPHRLLKDEIVLSRAQRKGLTHGQIVKILKAYKKSK